MEAIPTLRCLPRKSVLCCFLICTMLLLCAFYNSHYTDSVVSELKLSDINGFDKESQSRYSESGNTFQMREISNTESATHNKLLGAVRNTSSRASAKISNSVRQTAKPQTSSSTASSNSVRDVTVKSSSANTCSLKKENSKLILLWTPFFDYWNYLPQANFDQCSRCRNCLITTDKSKLLESDAVIFHARDMDVTRLPPFRLPNQRWVFYCLESPPYSDFPGLQHTQHMFNWTMTYRSDSDIPAPYGYVSKVGHLFVLREFLLIFNEFLEFKNQENVWIGFKKNEQIMNDTEARILLPYGQPSTNRRKITSIYILPEVGFLLAPSIGTFFTKPNRIEWEVFKKVPKDSDCLNMITMRINPCKNSNS